MKIKASLLTSALALLLFLPTRSAHAQAEGGGGQTWTFADAPNSGWFFTNGANYDIDRGWALPGFSNNVWVNAVTPEDQLTTSWNAVNVMFSPPEYGQYNYCNLSYFYQTSEAFSGTLDVWNTKPDQNGVSIQQNLYHIALSPSTSWAHETTTFYISQPGAPLTGPALMDFGFWGQGPNHPQWIRVDDVSYQCFGYNG